MKAAFSPPHTSGPGNNRGLVFLVAAGVLVLAGAVAVPFVRSWYSRPVIEQLSPAVGDPGGMITVRGHNFGADRGEGSVRFDDAAVTASSYLFWTDTEIQLRVPLYADTSLVRVYTEAGHSNARMFMSRDLLPATPANYQSGVPGPFVDSLSADSALVGGMLTIRGQNFGANRSDSVVLFSWMGESGFQGAADADRQYVSPQEASGEYVSWSDREIVVRVPDGAVTGGVAVRTQRGTSQMRYFQVEKGPGTVRYRGRRTYALSTFVTISGVQGPQPNELYIWMPFPAQSASQTGIKNLGRSVEAIFPDYRGLSVYRLADLAAGTQIHTSQDYLVQVYGVESEVDSDLVRNPPDPLPAVYVLFTGQDTLVPAGAKEIAALAKKTVGKEKNPYLQARMLLDALTGMMTWSSSAIGTDPLQALGSGKADSWDMAILYVALLRAAGIPANPVAGIVVDDSRQSWNHAWAEFYIYGLGWIPVDPALYSGADVGLGQAPFTDRTRYFGSMDSRHVAFTRGVVQVDRMAPGGRTVTASRRYSMQTIAEEASSGLVSYTSFWSDVEVTGLY